MGAVIKLHVLLGKMSMNVIICWRKA